MSKRGLIIGHTYSSGELEKVLGNTNERLFVVGNDDDAVVVQDEGNDNYQVLVVARLDSQPQGVEVHLKAARKQVSQGEGGEHGRSRGV